MSAFGKALKDAQYLMPLAQSLKQFDDEKRRRAGLQKLFGLMDNMQNQTAENFEPIKRPSLWESAPQTGQQDYSFPQQDAKPYEPTIVDPKNDLKAYKEAANKTRSQLFQTMVEGLKDEDINPQDLSSRLGLFSKLGIPDAPVPPQKEEPKYMNVDGNIVAIQNGKVTPIYGSQKNPKVENQLLPELSTNEADYYGKRLPGTPPENNISTTEGADGITDLVLGDANQTRYEISKKDYKPKYTKDGGDNTSSTTTTKGDDLNAPRYEPKHANLYSNVQEGIKIVDDLKKIKPDKDGKFIVYDPDKHQTVDYDEKEFKAYKESVKKKYVNDAVQLANEIGIDGPADTTPIKNIRKEIEKGYTVEEAMSEFKKANPDFPKDALQIMEEYFKLLKM